MFLYQELEATDIDQSVLTEVFGIYPIGLKHVTSLGGQKLYSSDRLRRQFLKAIKGHKSTKQIYPILERLTNEGKILPCYTVKSFLKYIHYKRAATDEEKSLQAFFAPQTNRTYMLFDNRVKYFVWARNKDLAVILIHELQHYAAWNMRMRFLSMHKGLLTRYYSVLFSSLFDAEIKSQHVAPVLKFLFLESELKMDPHPGRLFRGYEQVMMRYILPQIKKNGEGKIKQYMSLVNLYFNNLNQFISALRNRQKGTTTFYFALMKAYKKIGYRKVESLVGQETLFPSEIISITAERPTSQHYAVIKQL